MLSILLILVGVFRVFINKNGNIIFYLLRYVVCLVKYLIVIEGGFKYFGVIFIFYFCFRNLVLFI